MEPTDLKREVPQAYRSLSWKMYSLLRPVRKWLIKGHSNCLSEPLLSISWTWMDCLDTECLCNSEWIALSFWLCSPSWTRIRRPAEHILWMVLELLITDSSHMQVYHSCHLACFLSRRSSSGESISLLCIASYTIFFWGGG